MHKLKYFFFRAFGKQGLEQIDCGHGNRLEYRYYKFYKWYFYIEEAQND